MTDWKPAPRWPLTDADQPDWRAVEEAYRRMSPDRLLAELARINASLAEQGRSSVSSSLAQHLMSLDQPVLRSQRTADPSAPSDRGQRPSAIPASTSALDLLILSGRSGPRLAAKMVKAQAIARSRREAR